MNWRIVVAVVVAFVVGAGGGAFAEHERVAHEKKTTKSTVSVPRKATTVNFFGTKAKTACPTLSKWNASASAAYTATIGGKPWKTVSATLLTETAANTAAYQTLVPLATASGKAELTFLVAHNAKIAALVPKATSAASFRKEQAKLGSPRLTRDLANLTKATQGCKA